MLLTFFAINAYILMRAFEVVFADQKDARWYKVTLRAIGCVVLYVAVTTLICFYYDGIHFLGLNPK